jgi:multiple sugar transport system permease protein
MKQSPSLPLPATAAAVRPRSSSNFNRNLAPRLMVAPAIIVVLALTLFPLLWSLQKSLYAWFPSRGADATWVGLDNFVWVFTSDRFWNSMGNLVFLLVFGVGTEMVLGTALALALYEGVSNPRVRIVLLTVLLLPMMMPPIVVGDLWKFILTPQGGVLNYLLGRVGIGPQNWTGAELGMISITITDIWQWTALPLVIAFSGRASMPDSIYEAARLDGASRWFMIRRITLPLLKDLLVIALLLRVMDAYKLFDAAYIITRGGPGTATELPGLLTYLVGFKDFDIGRAAALTWVIALLAVLVIQSLWNVLRQRRAGL